MTAVDYRTQTTLVTGASSGIGAELARQLAARGSALVLVARRAELLEALAREIRDAHGVRVDVVPADLGALGAADRLAAEVAARGVRVTSLVNNAGFGLQGPFRDTDAQALRDMVQLDVAALTDLTRVFIDQLLDAGTGVLVNVASIAAYLPTPGSAVYGAAKAYVLHLTEALWIEYAHTGLRVLALSPGITRTEFFDRYGTPAASLGGVQDPAAVVGTMLRVLDRSSRPAGVVTGWRNRLLTSATRVIPRGAALRLTAAVLRAG
ncbi:SDR family NAD(P)-dependent oxidoreductase [Cellulomonas dongxiuzhuiae]|uniref:SDR family NAD(P)-dependent oxidoreductase n=1 Tax=Cellulomonas dongxiuzhuiae TaxID=2819979 RepID=UPI001AB017C9|nr:SDR family oxidoreductase [Cellulomonas dongxiuzhuiae]MBO3087858.1 SDR family oxidoreductase [Cellulomonas dongxiuzhuiae]